MEAYIYDAVRTPRGRGKSDGSLHDIDYWLETVEPTGLRAATEAEIEARAGGVVAPLILCGHTHVPRIHRRAEGGLIVNPGSVGLPAYDDDRPWPHMVETGSPEARYALIEWTADGWHAEIVLVTYDAERAAATADARGRPDWARALRTGRM